MTRARRSRLASLAAAFATTALTVPAAAEPYVAIAPEGWLVVHSGDGGTPAGSGSSLGGSVSAVGGLGLDFDPLLVGPQLAITGGVAGLHAAPDATVADASFDQGPRAAALLRVTGGGSIGVAGPVEISLFARGGFGLASTFDGAASSPGVAIDAGFTVEKRFSRDFTFGGQLGYAGLVATNDEVPAVHALTLGPRFGFWF